MGNAKEAPLVIEQTQVAQVTTPATLLELAVTNDADVDKLEKLMALQERYDAKQAKSAFLKAMTEFQAIVPRVTKHNKGYDDKYSYATLSEITEQIKDSLQACGLSFRFEQNHNDAIQITCVISHIDGHSEQTSMQAAPDGSGGKNAVQSLGSTVTYLQRYTLIGALGITTADEDIDARLPFQGLSEDQILNIEAKIEETEGDLKKFLKWKKVTSLEQISAADYESCVMQIEAAYKARQKQEASNGDS